MVQVKRTAPIAVKTTVKNNGHFSFGHSTRGDFLRRLYPRYDKKELSLRRCVELFRRDYKHTFPKDANMDILKKVRTMSSVSEPVTDILYRISNGSF